ncbi:MAG TPA: hypothetical protein VJ716_03075 [Gaiellaceae bacterium]|nr:hypothetical protein [Gaiellaceae bacterium]
MRGIAARFVTLLGLATLALVATASSGTAAGSVHARILGVVPHGAQRAPATAHLLSKAVRGAAGPRALTFDPRYESLINQYFTDVAADSGKTTNVYSVATQYNDGSGPVQYRSTFGGSYVDHDPLPANGCDDAHNGLHDAYCLTDQQLQIEIQAAMDAKGWQHGLDHVFFLMTPNGVGSCFDVSGNQCSTNTFCAYHSAFGISPADAVIYANEPYMGPLPKGDCTATEQGFPNNDVDAETTINTISHEHNEAITDPLGDAWIADDGPNGTPGDENGDLCAYGFGTPLGGTLGINAYNQVINTHHYELQQEWSNADIKAGKGCTQFLHDPNPTAPTPQGASGPLVYQPQHGPVMRTNTTYAIYWLPTPGTTTPPAVTGTAAVNKTLKTSVGAWTGAPTAFRYQWQRCSASGTGCVDIPGATAAAYKLTTADAGHSVLSTVAASNVNGASQAVASATTSVVVAVPTAKKAPHISGRTRVGRKLSGSHGSWTSSPKSYRLQWLRCNGHGARCRSIHHATHARYKLTKSDAKHRLRLRVTATNAAGSRKAVSKPSARVPAPKH